MKLYITGDCHGEFKKFGMARFPEQKSLTKQDYVIICGDFGGIWNGDKSEKYWLDWLRNKSFTLLFVDGNHENYDMLKEYTVEEWHGGKIHRIRDNVIHLMRGQVFEIGGNKVFTFGGASSHDIVDGILERSSPTFKQDVKNLEKKNGLYRVNHESWWEEELPSAEEMEEGIQSLDRHNWEVDLIITHCLSTKAQDILQKKARYHCFDSDRLTDYLSIIRSRCKFSHWFCGHYHINADITDKETILYEKIATFE